MMKYSMAKTRAKKGEVTANITAAQLLEVRSQINLLKKDEAVLTKMLKDMIRTGMGGTQMTYQLRKDMVLAIADVAVAQAWASEHGCLKVDVPSVDKFLKSNRLAIPQGFGLKETEKLVEIREDEIAQEEFIITG